MSSAEPEPAVPNAANRDAPDLDDADPVVLAAVENLTREELVALVTTLRDQVRAAQAELGDLRGDYAEMHVQLIRARQDQEMYQTWIDRWRKVEANAQRVDSKLRRIRRG